VKTSKPGFAKSRCGVISESLTFLVAEVNRYFTARLGPATPDRVVLGNIARLADNDGNSGGNSGDNGVAMLSLVNVEEDRVARNPENFRRLDDRVIYRSPQIHLNLYVLFTAHTPAYATALETLSYIVQCFQYRRTFDPTLNPNLDPRIEKLTVDLVSMNFEQVNHLWSTLGGKYLPSALYKVRMVKLDEPTNYAEGEPIREIELTAFSSNVL
jgi:hypothetical protein